MSALGMLDELQIIPEDADLRTPQALDMLKVKFTTGKNSAMEKSESCDNKGQNLSLGPSGTIDQGLTASIHQSKNITGQNSALGMMDELNIVPKSSSKNSFFKNALESLSGNRKQESRSKVYEIPRPETDTRDEFQKDSDTFSEELSVNSNPIAIAIENEARVPSSPVSVAQTLSELLQQ